MAYFIFAFTPLHLEDRQTVEPESSPSIAGKAIPSMTFTTALMFVLLLISQLRSSHRLIRCQWAYYFTRISGLQAKYSDGKKNDEKKKNVILQLRDI